MNGNKIIVPLRQNFSFKECLWYLDRNFDECLHVIEGNHLLKAIVIEGNPVLLDISCNNHQLEAGVIKGDCSEQTESAVIKYLNDWFDIEPDISPFYRMLETCKPVAYMRTEFAGLRLVGIPDLFEALCWSIIGQQINLPFAYKVKRRLVERYGEAIVHNNRKHFLFPRPEIVANITIEEFRDMQFSRQKAAYIIVVAKAFVNGILSKEKLTAIEGFANKQKLLTSLKGIGIWTANYVLMKTLREPSAIPYGDAGLLNALINHNIIKDKKDLVAINEFFDKFSGWESYVVFYLWRSLAIK